MKDEFDTEITRLSNIYDKPPKIKEGQRHELQLQTFGKAISKMAIHGGSRLAIGFGHGGLALCQLQLHQNPVSASADCFQASDVAITSLAWSDDGCHLAAGDFNGAVKIWRITTDLSAEEKISRKSIYTFNGDLLPASPKKQAKDKPCTCIANALKNPPMPDPNNKVIDLAWFMPGQVASLSKRYLRVHKPASGGNQEPKQYSLRDVRSYNACIQCWYPQLSNRRSIRIVKYGGLYFENHDLYLIGYYGAQLLGISLL